MVDGDQGLTVEGLTKRFGTVTAVDTLSFRVSRGQILALLGPNGAGKTTTLLCACGVLAATPVLLLDEPMIGLDPRGQRELRDLLVELRRREVAIMVSTHLLEYMEGLCDGLLIIKRGRALAARPIQDLRREHGGRSLEDVFLEMTES